ncbi:inactive TPR repeat-containing thioredoxin TTL3-like isoform X1 [Salvia hispanica]|uniref:inactive TPR repeat-containing thioredoxin TTL3-like isoform X1 n=1 Tax=Salvia hispanica TaxID=49212 RepID=UPI002009B82D|nr:inactive TPR repeat-containing thioredoxin TTL3-like isoform X1 [Salvia hispanica]
MGDCSPERRSGCGLLGAVFGRPKKSPSPTPVQTSKAQRPNVKNDPSNDQTQGDRVIPRPGPNYKSTPVRQHHPPQTATPPRNVESMQARKVPLPGMGLSGELDTMIKDHQRVKGAGNLVRASSGNVMLHSNLGNLRKPHDAIEQTLLGNRNYARRNDAPQKPAKKGEKSDVFCRALSTRMDPEELKILGNEHYKNGDFAEALSLYEAAISVDPNKASYRSNKSAALTAMGKLLEAALECREAIRIDPFYQRAHNRLATLYVRLGDPEKGLYHFKQAGSEADPDAMNRATKVQSHLNKCTEAKRQHDWTTLLKEIALATSVGADSAPLIFALKAEALLKLNRHQEAIQAMADNPDFDTEECTKFFGPIASASLLVMQARVGMAEGRFDDAWAAAEGACRLDPNNKEASIATRRAQALSAARSKGNDHFKAGRYEEARGAYGEGLEHAPYNALLLCNRAACEAKLNHYNKAVEDCNAALSIRPGYSKARLRRADCFAKMGNWGACLQDCQVLVRENPNDGEAAKLLDKAKSRLE